MRTLLVLLGYLAAVIWLTWPLAQLSFSHLPCPLAACTFDTLYSTWVLAWESHALATAPASLTDGNIYFPEPATVFYGPAGFGALPYFAPAFAITGSPAFAMNFTLILCTALAAAGLHLVVVRWTGRHAAGAVAAATLLTNRWILWRFVGTTPHFAPLHYFPFIILLAAAERPHWGRLVALLALIVLQSLTDPVYVAPAVFGPLGILALFRLSRPSSRRDGARLLAVLAAASVLLSPVYLGYLGLRESNPRLSEQTLWKVTRADFPLDLSSLFWAGNEATTVAPAALAVAVLGGVLAARRRRRLAGDARARDVDDRTAVGWRHALLWALLGTFLSFPPEVRWRGYTILIPQTLIGAWTPFYELIRVPSRLGIAGLMGICLVAGLGYAEIARAGSMWVGQGTTGRATQALLVIAVLALIYRVPPGWVKPLGESYRVQRLAEIPPSMRAILASGREPLVKLPALKPGWASPNPTHNAVAMYHSIFHWRPLLNGYSSYWPEHFVARMRLAERLPNRRALNKLVRETGLGLVWVDLRGYSLEDRRRWLNPGVLSRRFGLDLVARDGPQMLFAVVPPRTGSEELEGRAPGPAPSRSE